MNLKAFLVALFFSMLVTGCAITPNQEWSASPETINAELEGMKIKTSPACTSWGCDGFLIQITNTTDQDIEIDWNKTLYIRNGQTSGTFMYEGIVYAKRNETKSPDIVFPGGKLIKAIYPVNLVDYTSGQYGGWSHESMPAGENGIYLNAKIGGKTHTKKLVTEISVFDK